MRIDVLLVDDHAVLRDGLRHLLECHEDIHVVGAVSDGLEAIRHAEELQPDIVVMDISMPNLNGIEATRLISECAPEAGVVILSMHSSPDVIHRALSAGARGFVLKESSVSNEVVAAVRAVVAGRRYIGQGISVSGVDAKRDPVCLGPTLDDLTRPDRKILKLVAEGHSNAETAQQLGLSPRTVETYRSRMMEKLGLNNLPALVKFAIRNGIATLD